MRNGKGTTYATGFVKLKTTALLFDKIWLPQDMIEQLDSTNERAIKRFMLATDFGANEYIVAIGANIGMIAFKADEINEEEHYYSSYHRNFCICEYAEKIGKRYHIDTVPIYHDPTEMDMDTGLNMPELEFDILQICMANLPEIDEVSLEWKQVEEFRRDKDSVVKLRRFKLWLLTELFEKSKEEVECIFEKELDDYKFALKKHGIMTAMGGCTTILSASATILQSLNNGVFNEIAAGVAVTSGISLFVSQQIMKYIQTNRRPIAYIYDIARKFRR